MLARVGFSPLVLTALVGLAGVAGLYILLARRKRSTPDFDGPSGELCHKRCKKASLRLPLQDTRFLGIGILSANTTFGVYWKNGRRLTGGLAYRTNCSGSRASAELQMGMNAFQPDLSRQDTAQQLAHYKLRKGGQRSKPTHTHTHDL